MVEGPNLGHTVGYAASRRWRLWIAILFVVQSSLRVGRTKEQHRERRLWIEDLAFVLLSTSPASTVAPSFLHVLFPLASRYR